MSNRRQLRRGLLLVVIVCSMMSCSRSSDAKELGELRADAQAQLDAMMTGDADAAYSGWSRRWQKLVSRSELRKEFVELQVRLPEMKTWRFKILEVDQRETTGTVRTIAVDGDGKVVKAKGFSNNEDSWPFVLEGGRWRNDFCNS